ncbi:NADH-ubiquinone oxidoreductase [Ascobolus immersus RN42]|uniref:NADH dehydrogenase [ubiquinone] iron-sulfur protein 5 n=1 Tax=Ascobolus immersus RN42 TaxID=1160509 RepID=A0A3N4ILU8_ASCIM|nr:NADH-ubiquinone oxidoreductase [Ascobolus immersus RN42]
MASGFGINGGVGRCFPFWQDLLSCYVVNTNPQNDDGKWKCVPQMEDYYECLHHRKEMDKTKAMQIAFNKWEKEHPEELAKKRERQVGEMKSLGLLVKNK